AQNASSKIGETRGSAPARGELNASLGYSPASPTVIGVVRDRKFFRAALGYSFQLHQWNHAALRYVLDVVPVALVTQPAQIVSGQRKAARTIYGGGGSPIGFQVNFLPHS